MRYLYAATPLDPVVAVPVTTDPDDFFIVNDTDALGTGKPRDVTVAETVTD